MMLKYFLDKNNKRVDHHNNSKQIDGTMTFGNTTL
jgi:hypothetical protein